MGNNPSSVLIIGFTWPEPKTTAAGHRMMQLIKCFIAQNYSVTFATTASKTDYSENLRKLGIKTESILLNDSSFDTFIKEEGPNVVVFDRFMVEEQFGWRVAEFCPNAVRILNTEDLHSLRDARKFCFTKGEGFTYEKWLKTDMAKREMASVYRSDLTLLISDYEEALLQDVLRIDKNLLVHLPFMLDIIEESTALNWPSFIERKDFITFGNGKHAPNLDSLHYLKKDIWPLIRQQIPDATLHIYGAYLPQQILEMNNSKEGFMVHGWASDIKNEIQKARVVLAPLRFGAGIKGKLIDAMLNGTPSVTTGIGAEGMHGDLPWNGHVEDSPDEFAKAAIDIYLDKGQWQKAQQNGIEIINRVYDKTSLGNKFINRLEEIQNRLNEHRTSNFLGAILMHHTVASTKYLSKYIEEKNK